MKSIYLDYAAATPLNPRVKQSMEPYAADRFYNPSSSYLAAREVRRDIDQARTRVAFWLGARSSEVIFTAGATESINIAIHGVMQTFPQAKAIALATEHESVLGTIQTYEHRLAPVLSDGTVDMTALRQLIDDQVVLISIAMANSEIGTIQPITHIGQLLADIRRQRRATGNQLPLYLHTDASQAAGFLDLHCVRLGVDLLTLNGGKIYGPKQTGILYIRAGTKLTSPFKGGGQEQGIRSGTENVAGIIGLSTALDIVQSERKESVTKCAALRDELQRRLVQALPLTVINGNVKRRLPGSLHVSWPSIDGERLVMLLDEKGVMAATGSACAANKQTASHVLVACGLSDDVISGSLRLGVGTLTTPQEIVLAADIIIGSVNALG